MEDDVPPAGARARSGLLILFGLTTVAAYYLPGLLRQSIFSNDMTQWTAWAYRFQDPALFPGDPHAAYWMGNWPAGYYALFRLLAPWIDPQVLGETCGMLLGGITAYLGFRLGRLCSDGRITGGLAALLLIFVGQFSYFQLINLSIFEAGGLPRGFALPLLLLGFLGIVERRLGWFIGAVAGAGLFYPVTAITLGAIAGILAAVRLVQERRIARQSLWQLAAVFGAGAFAQAFAWITGDAKGRPFALSEIMAMPDFGDRGILPLFFARRSEYVGNALELDKGWAGLIWLLAIGTTMALIIRKPGRTIRAVEIAAIPAAAMSAYVLAYIALPRLYEPSRYLLFPYQMLTLICAAVAFDRAVAAILAAGWRVDIGAVLARRGVIAGLAAAILLINGANLAARIVFDRGGMADPMPAAMYRFIAGLPKDTVIAAMPGLADRIPMRSQRSVVVMAASFYPYHPQYYDRSMAGLDAVVRAIAAPDDSGTNALRQEFGASYLMLDTRAPLADQLARFEPIGTHIRQIGGPDAGIRGYAARQAQTKPLFRAGPYVIIALDGRAR